MNNKMIMALALDALLLELDRDYESVPQEVADLLQAKVFESYGMRVDCTHEEALTIQKNMINDVKKYRDKLFEELIN